MENNKITLMTNYRTPSFGILSENDSKSQKQNTRNIKPEDYIETNDKDKESNILNKILKNFFPERRLSQKKQSM